MPRVPRNRAVEGSVTQPAAHTVELVAYAGGSTTKQVDDGTEQPKWSAKPQVRESDWPAEPRKPMCGSLCGGTNDLFVRLELLETKACHETQPLANAGVEFPIPDRLKNSGKFNLKGASLADVHARVIIYDEDWGDDRLLGYFNKVNLGPILAGQKYLECPTEQDGVFTGNVYIEFSRKDDNTLAFKILGCREVNNMPPEAKCDMFKFLIGIFVCSYIMIYAVVMGLVQNPDVDGEECQELGSWSVKFDDILWFVLVTFASVGYGDYYPCTDAGRWANGIFILLNQLTLAWFFTVATHLIIMQSTFVQMTIDKIYKRFFDPTGAQWYQENQTVMTRDKDGDMRTATIEEVMKKYDDVEGDVDFSYKVAWEDGTGIEDRLQEEIRPYEPLTFARLNKELRSTMGIRLAIVLFFTALGTVVFAYLEDEESTGVKKLTFAQTFQFCLCTMSTVGYGDWAPTTRAGRVFGSFYILVGVSLLANFAGILVNHFIKERELKFSHKFLNSSLVSPKQLLQFDSNGDGSIDKYEYLVRSLVSCHFVTEDKIDLIMAKFYNLDADKSGTIDIEDFRQYDNKVSSKNITVE